MSSSITWEEIEEEIRQRYATFDLLRKRLDKKILPQNYETALDEFVDGFNDLSHNIKHFRDHVRLTPIRRL